MKVSELVQILQELDPQLEVLVSGYEGGYNNCNRVTPPRVFVHNYNDEYSWEGRHELLDYVKEYDELTQEESNKLTTFEGVVVY